ncbi:MAG: ComF family protein [Clostridiales bacterium]|nr:ComF family protein [Clostridiales bacterium]
MVKLKRILSDIIDIVYPRAIRCIACEREGPSYNRYGFCHDCFENLPFITDPRCEVCGRHFQGGGRCHLCMNLDHVFIRAIPVFEYDIPIIDIIHRFKYKGHTELASPMSMLMANALIDSRINFDAIIPVPLHEKRLKMRGFNQALYLAQGIDGIIGGNRLLDSALIRERNTPAQIGMDRAGRMWNLYGAFKVRDNKGIEDKRILLVDDVLTTGSTVDNCANELIDSGAKDVYVAVLAASILPKL